MRFEWLTFFSRLRYEGHFDLHQGREPLLEHLSEIEVRILGKKPSITGDLKGSPSHK